MVKDDGTPLKGSNNRCVLCFRAARIEVIAAQRDDGVSRGERGEREEEVLVVVVDRGTMVVGLGVEAGIKLSYRSCFEMSFGTI